MSRSIIIAVLIGLAAAGAHAQETVSVSSKGLNLDSPADAKTFYVHIRRAADYVCGGAPTNFFSTDRDRYDACFKAAVDGMVAKANAPLVSALNGATAPAAQFAAR
jgi:UrcA family protein